MIQKWLSLLCMFTLVSNAQLKQVSYVDEAQALEGLAGIPQKEVAEKRGVLILPAWMGIDKHAQESAEKLQKMGFYTFVADIYGVDQRPKNFKEASEKAGYYKKNFLAYQKRIQLAYNQLVQLGVPSKNIVVMGYCFGGTGALEAARMNLPVRGVVSFHGGLGHDATRPTQSINTRVLVLHGADDPYVSQEEIKTFQEEMRIAKADWEMIYYANAVHSFTDKGAGTDNKRGAAYNEKAAIRSWNRMVQFLWEVFE